MATTQKKPATKTAAASTATTTKRKTTAKKPAPASPVRRELWGAVLLVLALCVLVTYIGIEALFINYLALGLKAMFGYGYWLVAPALALGGFCLIFHYGEPVKHRLTAVLTMPITIGVLAHIFLCKEVFSGSVAVVGELCTTGMALSSGGFVSGILALGVSATLSSVVATVLFVIVLAGQGMMVARVTPMELWSRYKERPQYEPVERPAPRPKAAKPAKAVKSAEDDVFVQTSIPLTKTKPNIHVPLDGETPAPQPKEKKAGLTGFFRSKEDHIQTPDQVLSTPKTAPVAPATPAPAAPAPAAPVAPAPVAPVTPLAPPSVAAPTALADELPPLEKEPTVKEKAKSAHAEVESATAEIAAEIEKTMHEEETSYSFPPITLLHEGHSGDVTQAGAELRNNARRLAETLSSFNVEAKPSEVVHGPAVTRYEFVLDKGVKLSKLTNLSDDIALALGASGVRIAPIPEKISVVGIEVPNRHVTPVVLREVLESRDFTEHKSNVAFSVGKDIGGQSIIGDIARLPHVLVAGTTGSGKSVCTNGLIISLLYKSTPEDVRFIMVDPKMVELAPYNGIPHLLIPVVTDPKKAAGALQWAVFEMMKRYKLFSENNVKDLVGYNALAKTSEELNHLPSVVVVIDELADLMLVAAKEVEESICRVAQMGRAAGMHLVIATQRPSADVITGLMKANIPSRIAFAVASSLESRIILDTQGAEKLVGKGDMLYAPLGAGKPTRVQGCFISPEEIQDVVDFVKQSGEAQYSDEVLKKIEESVKEKEKGGKSSGGGGNASANLDSANDGDELFPAAVEVVIETGQASVSMLQRRLKLGYSRAARLVDQMEEQGIVGPFEGSKPRQLLISKAQWQERQSGGVTVPDAPEGVAEVAPTADADEAPF
ncbi:DNA translocase FtsK [Bengtsoniella intestinalis]|uniref:FtsK/SpoIIIE family DNA translocase n=1 Tax=Bengtsoniella intestinalis TaxID=3073143 RepID=UPI00391FA58A